jgi:hypothetical protein
MFYTEPASYDSAYPVVKDTIPPSALGYHSNNKYDGFPPLMSDGRSITASYQPEAVLNEHLLKEIGVQTNWQYRQYLMKNSKEIQQYNRLQTANDAGYFKRYADPESSSYSTPFLYQTAGSTQKPQGYSTSDLKDVYLSREQLQARMVAPELTQAELYQTKVYAKN